MLKKSIAAVVAAGSIFSAGVFAANGTFSDVPAGSWFEEAANWANEAGLITGRSAGQFAPDGNVTRAELAVVLKRYDDYLAKMDMKEDMMDEEMGDDDKEEMKEGEEMMDEGEEKMAEPEAPMPTIEEGMMGFKVTVKNPSTDQPLSPGVFVVHTDQTSLNFKGKFSHASLEALAEWGDPADFAEYIKNMDGVIAVHVTDAPIAPGGEQSFVIQVEEGKRGYFLSGISMAVGSNDGFALIDAMPMFDRDNNPAEMAMKAMNYDNGTEENSELNSGFEGGQPDPEKGEANKTNGKTTLPQAPVALHEQLTETIMEAMVMPIMPKAEETETEAETQ